jgi:hypothetical protein
LITAAMCGAQSSDLPGMAAGILAQTELARQAVSNRDQASALEHVRQAQSFAAEIQTRTAGQPAPVLIPVRQETETTTYYSDVKHRKYTHVGGVEQQTISEELNVTASADRLRAAQAALQRTDWAAADAELAGVGNLVRTNRLDPRVPLLEAKKNLMLARERLAQGKYSAAVAPLRAAENALAGVDRATVMRDSIEAMADHIHHEGLIAQIDQWVQTLDQWQRQ